MTFMPPDLSSNIGNTLYIYKKKEQKKYKVSAINNYRIQKHKSDSTSSNDYIVNEVVINDSDNSEEIVEINTLINFQYNLKKPINVIIKRNNFEYIGDIPQLEIYSFGQNKFEVLREINEELTDLFVSLSELSDEQLGQHPKKWKSILEEYIQFIND